MPGGPLPKPAGQRRRRNLAPRGVQLPIGGRKGPIPPLSGASELLPSSRALWRELWRSPMAVTWLEIDAYPLRRMVSMVDARERGDSSSSLASEIRQLEDRFGLSPIARRRLNYEISAAAANVADLRVVSDDGGDPRLSIEERLSRMDPRALQVPGVDYTNGGTR